jgi:hypothetical protein
MPTYLGYLIAFAGYALGAAIFILDAIEKYYAIAQTSTDPSVVYKRDSFWLKERFNLIRITLLGVVSIIIWPRILGNGTLGFFNADGVLMLDVPIKAASLPIQIITGWTGGRIILAIMGKSKKELYKKVGLDESGKMGD